MIAQEKLLLTWSITTTMPAARLEEKLPPKAHDEKHSI